MSEDAHARPTGNAPEPLYDVNIPTPTHAERARTLVAQISTGTLCTLALEPEGYPYGSFVTVAFDNGDPIFLISGLAEHTKNLERDPRASLLVAEGGSADPLANGRVTMLGPCTRVEEDGGSARRVLRRSSELNLLRRLPRFRVLEAACRLRPLHWGLWPDVVDQQG
jgi:heme iron utilization protein